MNNQEHYFRAGLESTRGVSLLKPMVWGVRGEYQPDQIDPATLPVRMLSAGAGMTAGIHEGRYSSSWDPTRSIEERAFVSHVQGIDHEISIFTCVNTPSYTPDIYSRPFGAGLVMQHDFTEAFDFMNQELNRMQRGMSGTFSPGAQVYTSWDTVPTPTPLHEITHIQTIGRQLGKGNQLFMSPLVYETMIREPEAEPDEAPDAVEVLKERTRSAIREKIREQRRSKRW